MNATQPRPFLCEALRGSFDLGSEDRLTQVFVSCFNHSPKFRTCFSKFINHPLAPHATASPQRSFLKGTPKRPDVCISYGKSIKVVLENKIEAPLTAGQLKTYSSIKELSGAKKIAMVKHYFEAPAHPKGWRILHWSDFCRFLEGKNAFNGTGTSDHFIIHSFISLLEEIGMKTPNRITKLELQHLAKALHNMRNNKGPDFSLKVPAFEIANNYIDMLEAIIARSREDPVIRKRAAGNYQFNPKISAWYRDDNEKNHMRLSLSVEIKVKPKATGLRCVATGIFFSNQHPAHFEFLSYGQKPGSWEFEPETRYKASNLQLDKYATHVISTWRKWLK